MVSAVDICKRTLVKLIHTLASAYGCCVTLTRESSDADVKKAFRKVSKKTHPDHGGSTADQQRLNAAYEEWCQALRDRGSRGRPRTKDSSQVVLSAAPPTSTASLRSELCQSSLAKKITRTRSQRPDLCRCGAASLKEVVAMFFSIAIRNAQYTKSLQ